jgi:hypothetical protein
MHVLFDAFGVAPPISLRIDQQLAQLAIRETLPDHWILRRWQMPIRRTWRYMHSRQIAILMTRVAVYWRSAIAIRAAPHVHDVPV